MKDGKQTLVGWSGRVVLLLPKRNYVEEAALELLGPHTNPRPRPPKARQARPIGVRARSVFERPLKACNIPSKDRNAEA